MLCLDRVVSKKHQREIDCILTRRFPILFAGSDDQSGQAGKGADRFKERSRGIRLRHERETQWKARRLHQGKGTSYLL